MRFIALATALTMTLAPLGAPAGATPQAAETVVTVVVTMAEQHFRPQVVRLQRGRRYRLVLVNRDVTGHNFDSKGFFSHADIGPGGAGRQAIRQGMISVPSQSTRVFQVTPRSPGPFDLTSSVALDVAADMRGQIRVY